MPIKSCFGLGRKETIIRLYDIEPGPHCVMLPSQVSNTLREECCKKPLKHEFYQFFYTPKGKGPYSAEFPEESGSFFVGTGCGPEFLKLLRKHVDPSIADPPRFNPLELPIRPRRERAKSSGGRRPHNPLLPQGPTSVNFELTTIIQLIATICPTPLQSDLCDVLNWLRQNPEIDSQDWSLLKVNRAIKDHPEFHGRTLRQAMDDEATLGVRWRSFSFSHVERIIRDQNEKSFIDPTAVIPDDPPLRQWATILRSVDGGYRLHMDDDTEENYSLLIIGGCRGAMAHTPFNVGDRLLVRLSEHPDCARAVQCYDVGDRALTGTIKYVNRQEGYGFLAVDDNSPNINIPNERMSELPQPVEKGLRLAVRAVPGVPNRRAVWVRVLPPN